MPAPTAPGSGDRDQVASAFVATAAAAISLALTIRTVLLGYRFYSTVPYMDQWDFAGRLPALFNGSFSLADLFAQHNEHRIVTSKLLFIVDALAFDFSFYFCCICAYVICIAIAYMVSTLAGKGHLAIWLILCGLIVSPAQYENLANGFQVPFPIVQICATGSLLCLIRVLDAEDASVRLFIAAVVLDALAVFSLASGLFLIVPAVWLAIIYRRRAWRATAYIACHLISTGLFFRGYNQSIGVVKSHKIFRICEFAILYLGSCLRDYGPAAAVAGCIMVVMLAYAVVEVTASSYRQRSNPDRCQVAAVALAQFTAAGAVVTGIGRASMGLEAASAPRYAFCSLMMVASLFVFFRRRWAPGKPLAGSMLTIAVLIVSLLGGLSPQSLAEWQDRSRTSERAGFALVNGVWSDPTLETIFPVPDAIKGSLRFLAQHRLAMFSPRFASRYQPPLNALQDQDASAPLGCGIDVATLDRTGPNWIEITAAVSDRALSDQDRWILVFDDERRLLGYTRQQASWSSVSEDTRFGIALNAGELAHAGTQSLTFVVVPQSTRQRNCRSRLSVELPP